MLFLLFQVGNDRYALEANRVVEVIPLLTLKHLPRAPRGVAGLFNYRGQPVPALDLSDLLLGQPAAERLSTRIIIVQLENGTDTAMSAGGPAGDTDDRLQAGPTASNPNGSSEAPRPVRLLGLVAEHATEVVRREAGEFLPPGLKVPGAPFLGPVLLDKQGPVQWIHEQHLLSGPVSDLLFSLPADLVQGPD